jgi:fatty acid synthase subunit alpha, fungi type
MCLRWVLYAALASIADALPIAALVEVVFYRGIMVQRAVEQDSKNRSNYVMCTINPSRILNTFSDAAFREVIDSVALLEIVNYNVEVLTLSVLIIQMLISSLRASSTYVLES